VLHELSDLLKDMSQLAVSIVKVRGFECFVEELWCIDSGAVNGHISPLYTLEHTHARAIFFFPEL